MSVTLCLFIMLIVFSCLFFLHAEEKVEVPHAFPFPFQPYDIQLDLMRKLYEALELGKIGIFESPTGTVRFISVSFILYFADSFKFYSHLVFQADDIFCVFDD